MQDSTLASMESLGNIPNWIRCPRFPRVCWHNFSKIWFLCPRFKMTVEFWKALINWDIFYFNSESGSNTGRRFWTSSRVFNQTHFISNSIFHPIENSGFRFSNVQEFKHEGLIFLMHTRTLHNVNENFICSLAPPGGQNQKSESIASKFVMSRFCCENFFEFRLPRDHWNERQIRESKNSNGYNPRHYTNDLWKSLKAESKKVLASLDTFKLRNFFRSSVSISKYGLSK